MSSGDFWKRMRGLWAPLFVLVLLALVLAGSLLSPTDDDWWDEECRLADERATLLRDIPSETQSACE